MKWLSAVLLFTMSGALLAGEIAYTVRSTALKAKPYADAATLITLDQRSRVVVEARRASWMQVKARDKTGWVKMLSLQFSYADQNKTGDNGLRALFNVASGGGRGGSVTTGVRGLSEENLKNAHPDPQALKVVQDYAVNQAEAKKFADAGRLHAQDLSYVADDQASGDEQGGGK